MFDGDTIYAEATVVNVDPSGVVTVAPRGLNQRGEAVLSFERKIVVPERGKEPANA